MASKELENTPNQIIFIMLNETLFEGCRSEMMHSWGNDHVGSVGALQLWRPNHYLDSIHLDQ
eukprot:scaffold513218_cov19-Prasinocladus_malaysianus.AAC.1